MATYEYRAPSLHLIDSAELLKQGAEAVRSLLVLELTAARLLYPFPTPSTQRLLSPFAPLVLRLLLYTRTHTRDP